MKFVRRVLVAAVICAVALFAAAAAVGYALYGDRSHPAAATQVIIARGSTFDEIARRLAENGIVSNVWTFRVLARLRKQDVAVRAGEYRFAPHLTQDAVLRALVTGGAQVAAWATIPEGFTAAQIAARFEEAGIGPAPAYYREFMHDAIVVDGARTKNLEGFLFPSTYLVPLGAAPSQAAGMLTSRVPARASRGRRAQVPRPARQRPSGRNRRLARGARGQKRRGPPEDRRGDL